MKFKDKTAIITGASSGIGKAIALRFQEEGANVVNLDIAKPDYDVEYQKVDVRNEDEIRSAIEKIEQAHVVVNAAGIFFLSSAEKTSKEELDRTVDINLKGTFLMCKFALPLLRKTKGNIINIASGLGVVPDPDAVAYCATKAGIIMLTKCLAQEQGVNGVRINSILPGPVDTPLLQNAFSSEEDMKALADANPMKRVGQPQEVANVALFLASDEASYVTGAQYAVDGGESSSSLYSK